MNKRFATYQYSLVSIPYQPCRSC